MVRILMVEDEDSVSDPLSFMLTAEGFDVETAATGPEGLALFEAHGADLVLLDVMLPGMLGTDVCRAIRAHSTVPIIMLSARDDEVDRVVGLELGADDYVTKPFSARELLARIRALLRWRTESGGAAAHQDPVVAGPVTIDMERHVVEVNGKPTSFPLREFELLEYLVRRAGRVRSRRQILDYVWGPSTRTDSKTLDVHIKRLRQKIEEDPTAPRHLITVRGMGYIFEA